MFTTCSLTGLASPPSPRTLDPALCSYDASVPPAMISGCSRDSGQSTMHPVKPNALSECGCDGSSRNTSNRATSAGARSVGGLQSLMCLSKGGNSFLCDTHTIMVTPHSCPGRRRKFVQHWCFLCFRSVDTQEIVYTPVYVQEKLWHLPLHTRTKAIPQPKIITISCPL